MNKKSRRILFPDIAKRITGISTLVFWVSWNPPEDKCDIVRHFVAYLEDPPARYTDYNMEYGPSVEESSLRYGQS